MSLVYFIKPVGLLGPIKIGCTTVCEKRLADLSVWSPFLLEIVATRPGNFRTEINLHECFADSHSHREWFHPSPKLLAALDKLRAGLPLHEAVDLNDRVGSIRSWASKKRKPNFGKYMSYSARLRHAEKCADQSGARYVLADETDAIMRRWMRREYDPLPTAEEFAHLNAVIADPLSGLVPLAVKYPPKVAA